MKSFFFYFFLIICSLHANEPKRSKYFIALKKNDGNYLNTLHEYSSLLPPRNLLYADPMLFKYGSTNYIFFEDYDYQKGTIAFVTVDEHLRCSKPIHILELSEHLSFPFVFEDGGKIYMTPETIQSNEVAIFEAQDFPYNWKKVKVLVQGKNFTDPIIFKHNGYYWLFTAIDVNVMQIFYAENLFSTFKPHPFNKSRKDGRNAGGVFYSHGRLIRPVMDNSKYYGHSMILKEIVELTPTTFIERDLHRIDPTWAPGLDGTHTFNLNEDLVIYDGRRKVTPSEDPLYSSD